jgi:hypothetical protein
MRKDDGLFDGTGGTGREIDRRTIAKGVAWTVPVVIVATAAPAAAASGGVTPSAVRSGTNLVFTFVNDGSQPVKVVITSISTGSGWATPTKQENIPGGQSRSVSLADKSAGATTVIVTYTVDGAGPYTTSVAVG